MESQSSFFSLSGFTGILLGILSSLAIFLVSTMTHGYGVNFDGFSQLPILFIEIGIVVIGVLTILVSVLILWKRGRNKAKKRNQKFLNTTAKKQRFNLLLPLLVFLILLIIVANKGYYRFITPLLLFLYGLLLLNLSRFHSKSLLYVSMANIILALVAFFTFNNEILLLTLGFGILPIVYGLLTLKKNKKATLN